MCYMFKSFGVLAVIPATVLLALSFFVLLAMRKLDSKQLKVFGKVVAVLLWVSAALVILTGVYSSLTNCRMKNKMSHMMEGGMNHPMMQGQLPPEMLAR